MAKATAKKDTGEVTERIIKVRTLTQEQGRRRLNRERVKAGEKKVRSAAFYLAGLSGDEIKALQNGKTVRKTYGSGKVEQYKLG